MVKKATQKTVTLQSEMKRLKFVLEEVGVECTGYRRYINGREQLIRSLDRTQIPETLDDPVDFAEFQNGWMTDAIAFHSVADLIRYIEGFEMAKRITERLFVSQKKATTLQSEMERLGFILEETGGGCTGYCRKVGEDMEQLITLSDAPVAPKRLTDAVEFSEWQDGYLNASTAFDSVSDLVRYIEDAQ